MVVLSSLSVGMMDYTHPQDVNGCQVEDLLFNNGCSIQSIGRHDGLYPSPRCKGVSRGGRLIGCSIQSIRRHGGLYPLPRRQGVSDGGPLNQ